MFQDKRRRTLTVLLGLSLLVCAFGQSAQAITFFRASADFDDPAATYEDIFADIANEPNSGIWWNQATITYSLDDTFKSVWPNPLHQDLVREVFTLWGGAISRDYGDINSHLSSYPRWGETGVYDIATIALHELGHGVGLGHPFGGAAADPMLNFHFTDWDTGIPYDGTQTWEPEADTGLEVMGYGAAVPGAFNRQLSWDELNGARYTYLYGPGSASGLNFVEVTDGSPTDIVVTADSMGWDGGGTLAMMPPEWNLVTPGDPTDGGVIYSSEMIFNSDAASVIGTQPSAWTVGWLLDLTYDAYGIELDVSQSSDATLVGQVSGTTGNHYLEVYSVEVGETSSSHTWTHPDNNHPLVGPTIVGLEFDKPTWGPTAAYTTDEDGNLMFELPATNAIPFQHTGLPDDDIGPWLKTGGMQAILPTVLEQGITLRGSEGVPSLLTRILLADVTGMGLGLGDLNDDLLDLVAGVDVCVPCLGDIVLGADGIDHVLVFSDGSNLTAEMLADSTVAYHILDSPGFLVYDEMVVVLESEALVNGSLLQSRSYSLLGRSITGIPDIAGPAFLLGDANQDGVVSADDFSSVQANLGSSGAQGGGLLGDANQDGVVSADDFASIQANFGNHLPEPATLGLLAMGLIAFFRRRRWC